MIWNCAILNEFCECCHKWNLRNVFFKFYNNILSKTVFVFTFSVIFLPIRHTETVHVFLLKRWQNFWQNKTDIWANQIGLDDLDIWTGPEVFLRSAAKPAAAISTKAPVVASHISPLERNNRFFECVVIWVQQTVKYLMLTLKQTTRNCLKLELMPLTNYRVA